MTREDLGDATNRLSDRIAKFDLSTISELMTLISLIMIFLIALVAALPVLLIEKILNASN